ncbi:MAG TPA: SRPBCC family protein [Gemmatimonadaceae bacterium]|jgi:hypothetical protein|nr:SRPBCC family protein [Gemmatimonadaceae bacterium]
MLLNLALTVLGVLAVLVAFVATRPSSFRVARGAIVFAPAEVVFTYIEDLHRWERWSPFERSDPTMTRTYSGARAGVGASVHYAGLKIGEGRMTIVESAPCERIRVRAEFISPFAATNEIEFTLTSVPGGVAVTWAMSGKNSFAGKAISLVMNMDRTVGDDFERGLADLKRLAENEAHILTVA